MGFHLSGFEGSGGLAAARLSHWGVVLQWYIGAPELLVQGCTYFAGHGVALFVQELCYCCSAQGH